MTEEEQKKKSRTCPLSKGDKDKTETTVVKPKPTRSWVSKIAQNKIKPF